MQRFSIVDVLLLIDAAVHTNVIHRVYTEWSAIS